MIAAEQARVCAVMTVCGLALGGIYDVMGLIRRSAAALFADLAFGPVCALMMIAAGLALETDVFRLYTFLSLALGMTVYALTIGTAVRRMKVGFRRIGKYRKILRKNLHNDAGKGKQRANMN